MQALSFDQLVVLSFSGGSSMDSQNCFDVVHIFDQPRHALQDLRANGLSRLESEEDLLVFISMFVLDEKF